jgi:hypothetical protein
MRSREPVPDRNYGGGHPEQEPPGQHPDSKQDLSSRPSLTIAEADRQCGVSASTIRRHLAAGRFSTANQQPSPVSGQRGLWRIPTRDLLAAGLRPRQGRTPDPEQEDSQEGKAAIIGRALSRQRPPKRRWPYQPSRSSPPALPLAPPPTAAGSGRPIGPDDPCVQPLGATARHMDRRPA